MPKNIPIITCGNNQHDAEGVHAGMKPEFDVIYAAFDLPSTLTELPRVLAGRDPPSPLHTQIASNDFSRRPVAIIAGGGYDDEAFERLRNACIDACGSKAKLGVVFFRADNELTDRLVAEGKGPAKRTPEYAKAIAGRLKGKLVGVNVGGEGELKGAEVGEVVLY